jgi:Domain of unknown function (DUF802)
MKRLLHGLAFVTGLVAIGWVGAGYVHTHPLALAITALIGAFYLIGAWELRRFRQATTALDRALHGLAEPMASLADWLGRLPPDLHSAVRLRIEGERVALPGPALTPYLAGLLVLLGMLGTFLGMVVTLSGTSVALERATDLQTMRDSLAAPVKGLGLAFGTSVAGVAASALLGLMSALCRRDRLQVSQRLDAQVAGSLRPFSRAHQREQSLRLQQQQAELMPALADQLRSAMAQLQAQAEQANAQLLASQQQFLRQAESAYQALAASVDQSLKHSLSESARVAAATIQPAVQATMDGITRETAALHDHIASAVGQQLEGLSSRFKTATQTVTDTWTRALAQHEHSSVTLAQRLGHTLDGVGQGFEQRSATLVDTLAARHAALTEQMARSASTQLDGMSVRLDQAVAGLRAELAERDEQRLAGWTGALTTMAGTLQRAWQQAGEQTLAQQAQICATLEHTAERISTQAEAHARSTIAEIARLVQTASEAPRAAAELVAQLRDQRSDSMARDNTLLEERSRIMAALNTLLDAVQHSATEQRAAIDRLVGSTAAWLDQAGEGFTQKVDAESARMESAAAQLGSSAVDIASLGEAFGVAVEGFSQSSDKLMAHLQRVDDTLAKAIARSDEQLAYYVAQAREVIDLSLMSQKQIVEDLQRIAGRRAVQGSEA